MDASLFAALLLGDGRFPAGGHAHSAGLEEAVADGRVRDLPSLEAFTRGRLRTAGLVDAAFAAATVRRVGRLGPDEGLDEVARLDDELDARIPAPLFRRSSRRLGRQLVRVASRCWPAPLLAGLVDRRPEGAHVAVATGCVGVAAELEAGTVARLVLHHATATPTQAAVKLLGLDPFEVVAMAARMARLEDDLAAAALQAAEGEIADLPALGGPVVDLAALDHERAEVRMFAS